MGCINALNFLYGQIYQIQNVDCFIRKHFNHVLNEMSRFNRIVCK